MPLSRAESVRAARIAGRSCGRDQELSRYAVPTQSSEEQGRPHPEEGHVEVNLLMLKLLVAATTSGCAQR